MKQNQPTIWIDLTTSSNWSGPLVGIIRTEQALNQALEQVYPQGRIKRCIWRYNKFILLTNPKTQKTHTLKGILKSIESNILSSAPSKLRSLIHCLLKALRNFMSYCRKFFLQFPKPGKMIFQPGDILLTLTPHWNPHFSLQFSNLRKHHVKIVTCFHDLIPHFYPQYCSENWIKTSNIYSLPFAESSDLIICPSKCTQKDLLKFLKKPTPSCVIPWGSHFLNNSDRSLSHRLFSEKFILYVSTVEKRKNHEVIYRAYHLLCQQGKKALLPKFVFIGRRERGMDSFFKDISTDPLIQGLMVHLSSIPDALLHGFYQHALFCVFPSLYEGYGLPIAEALSIGKFVLSSDRGSLPEIGKDFIRYLDPWSPDQWANAILELMENPNLLAQHEQKIKKFYQPPTWEEAAQTLKNSLSHYLDFM